MAPFAALYPQARKNRRLANLAKSFAISGGFFGWNCAKNARFWRVGTDLSIRISLH
jgi:hypothetical protein